MDRHCPLRAGQNQTAVAVGGLLHGSSVSRVKRHGPFLFHASKTPECYRGWEALMLTSLEHLERHFRRVDRGEMRQTLPDGIVTDIGGQSWSRIDAAQRGRSQDCLLW